MIVFTNRRRPSLARSCAVAVALLGGSAASADIAPGTPMVARIEMSLAVDEEITDTIEPGDLLTVVREREEDYVIVTHDGTRGAVDKVNAVAIAESVDIYTDLIERNPAEGRFHTLRAAAHWELGDAEAALADFDAAIDKGYEASHAFVSRGLFHAAMGRFEEAIEDYDRALELQPGDVAPRINRAAANMRRGEFDAAIEDYTAVLEKRPESASILRQRALAHKAAGHTDDAAADFGTILKNNPEDRSAIMGRGYLNFQAGRHAEAVEDFGRAIELDDEDPVAWNNRGFNRALGGRWADAVEDYRRAIELEPRYALAHQNLAWALATGGDEQRDAPEAVAAAEKAAELNGHAVVGDLSALAAALAADGKFEEAIGWQEKVVEMIDPQYREVAAANLERYQNEETFAAE